MSYLNAAVRAAVVAIVTCTFAAPGRGEAISTAHGPEHVVREFYAWYVHAVAAQKDPFAGNRAQLKRYATDRLIREIDKMRKGPDGLDGDPFLDAQDFDQEWARNITVSNLDIKGTTATVDVQLKGPSVGTRNLQVTLVDERGWKVDKVRGK